MNTTSNEFMYAVYTILFFHVVVISVILYKRYRKKKK